MKLARKPHAAGDKIRYEVDYCNWLVAGDTLTVAGSGVALSPGSAVIDVTISGVLVTADHIYFFVQGGSISEVFTVTVTAEDSRGEITIDTVDFFVIAP